MKRALIAALMVCIAAIAVIGYVHHRRLVKQRQEFDATSEPLSTTAPAKPSSSTPAAVAAPSLIEQLPAGASAVVFVDVAALRGSSFANELAGLAPTPAQDPDYTEFVRATGFDYSRDLDQAAIALWPQSSPTSVFALAKGRFNHNRIERYAERTGRHVNVLGMDIYEVREDNSPRTIRFTFLAHGEIALADGPALRQFLISKVATHLDPEMSARAARVSGAPIYAVARTQDLPKDLGIDASKSAQLARLLRSVHAITAAGRPSANNLKVSASAECDSTFDALELSTTLQGLLWMGRAALADPNTRQQIGPQWPALDALLKAADITHESRQVQLRIQVTPQMLQGAVAAPANGTGDQ